MKRSVRVQAGSIKLQAYDYSNTSATPMVIVHGIQDFALAFSDIAGEITRRVGLFRNAEHVEIAEAGHMIHLDAPERLIEIIRERL